jgi:hypothetical protein
MIIRVENEGKALTLPVIGRTPGITRNIKLISGFNRYPAENMTHLLIFSVCNLGMLLSESFLL